MLKIFKPNWIVIEVAHERYTFDTYYTYCRHMTLEEVEKMFMLNPNMKHPEHNGAWMYDQCEKMLFDSSYITEDGCYEFSPYFTTQPNYVLLSGSIH